jgi:hypothetical protein
MKLHSIFQAVASNSSFIFIGVTSATSPFFSRSVWSRPQCPQVRRSPQTRKKTDYQSDGLAVETLCNTPTTGTWDSGGTTRDKKSTKGQRCASQQIWLANDVVGSDSFIGLRGLDFQS